MARIRTIKPEFWSSEQIMECSTNARLLFIGLWNFCDDAGRIPFKPRQIKAQVFPGDDFSSQNILGMIQELSANGLVSVYTVDQQEYFNFAVDDVDQWQDQPKLVDHGMAPPAHRQAAESQISGSRR